MEMPRILIIDDESDWREDLKIPLQPLGYEIRTASCRAEAFECLEHERFDVVVLNIRLDFEIQDSRITSQWTVLLDAIRQKQTDVIIVTSEAYPSSIALHRLQRMAFKDYGVSDFFIKEEFNVREYRNIVQETIEKRQELLSSQVSGDHISPETFRQIEEFLSHNKIIEAIDTLSELASYRKEAIILSRQWNNIRQQQRQQLITDEEANTELNKITLSILDITTKELH